mgnify:CR=1 FL=1
MLSDTVVHIQQVEHRLVPKYLSASDFAFATYSSTPSKRYLSPVKVGEYWANGLPVLLTKGVGDDSDIIEREGGGALFTLDTIEADVRRLDEIVAMGREYNVSTITPLAYKYRSFEIAERVYDKLLSAVSA